MKKTGTLKEFFVITFATVIVAAAVFFFLMPSHVSVGSISGLAIVLGTEGDGLARETISRCDYTVRIPMHHDVDSLNVAAASAVAFWQLRA